MLEKLFALKYKLIPLLIAILSLLYGIFLIFMRGISFAGIAIFISIMIICFSFFLCLLKNKNPEKPPSFIRIFCSMTFYAYFFVILFLLFPIIICSIQYKYSKEDKYFDYIVVHGANMTGNDSVKTLVYERLDEAYNYAISNPRALLCLSGGKMKNEAEPEAVYMANYLEKMGIDKSRFILEDKSFNTYTNIDYSLRVIEKDIIDRNKMIPLVALPFNTKDDEYKMNTNVKIAFLSSDFHLYRIKRMAKNMGLENFYLIASNTELVYKPYLFLKECLSLFKAYLLGQLEEKFIKEINSKCKYLIHKKTNAKLVLIMNEDNNKVFNICFKTPVNNSKGIPHILEHSVLCGSKKYPIKDPFVELAKGSMNTFLNAMTYPDKTCYPVASCNIVDFKNLMDIYLDAVFNPNIYKNDYILKQEGHHLELFDKNDKITINGVVYNEMKGVYSDPNSILERIMYENLYHNTTYKYEYGGDPKFIPELTKNEFLNFHKKYYHPSNSIIVLYGNMNFDERLEYLDKEYLSKYEYSNINSNIELVDRSNICNDVNSYYNYNGEDVDNKSYFSITFLLDNKKDIITHILLKILSYILVDKEGALLKENLLKLKFCEDVDCIYQNEILESNFSIILKNAKDNIKEEFIKIVFDTFNSIIDTKINKDIYLSALNRIEFEYRECESGNIPKGLLYSLNILESTLYNDSPFIYLEYEKAIDFLKKININDKNSCIYEFIKNKFIDSNDYVIASIKPKKNLLIEKENKLIKQLELKKNSLSDNELEKIIKETIELKKYQESKDSIDDIKKIHLLSLNDIERKKEILNYEKMNNNVIFVKRDTNDIIYFSKQIKIENFSDDKIYFLSILTYLLGKINTINYDYEKLNIEIDKISDGFYANLNNFKNGNYLFLQMKSTKSNFKKAISIFNEIQFNTIFDDSEHIKKLLNELKMICIENIQSSSHIVSSTRGLSNISDKFSFKEKTSTYSISFFLFLCDLINEYELNKDIIIDNLKCIYYLVFSKLNFDYAFSYNKKDEEILSIINKEMKNEIFINNDSSFNNIIDINKYKKIVKNEAFITSSEVNYVCIANNNYYDNYNSTLRFLKTFLSYEYLWENVRVLGGAYGCMCNFFRNKDSYFVSYRDPNIIKTIDCFHNTSLYLQNEIFNKDLYEKYIISTISHIDNPISNMLYFNSNLDAYYDNIDNGTISNDRIEILSLDENKIKHNISIIDDLLKNSNICVIGQKSAIEENKKIFDDIKIINV
ncbi:MAG: ElyC/SanA/YdcF family protein [Eubacteriales bacterium]|nr:ElyC/SanA/YdcF family protein [Eubacteriales bacterium]